MSGAAAPVFDVIGLGASSVDLVYTLPAAPEVRGPHSKLPITSHFVSCGGQVATMVAACASFGLRAGYLGPLGHDAHAALVRDELARRGVDLSQAIVREAPNQFAVILIDERTGERIVLWRRDPGLGLDGIPLDLPAARVLHVDDVDEEVSIRAARLATSRGMIVTSDLDRVTGRTAELVASVTIPIFDEHVPARLTGERDPERALRALRKDHGGLLCVTLGDRGAMALDGDRIIHAPAHPVVAVDTTAAGDVFRAGLVTALLEGRATETALAFANVAAALSCTRRGAMAGIPARREVDAALAGAGEGRGLCRRGARHLQNVRDVP
jgi:sugar/nucleoside kinase (ribokinase family)